MAATTPVALCTQLLPSGKLCRGIALRGQHYCRSHIRTYRILEQERQHDDAMSRLSARLDALDTLQVLQILQSKLDRITSIVRAYPEARLTLTFAIDRLQALEDQARDPGLNPDPSSLESNACPQLTPDQIPEDLSGFSPSEINQMIIGLGGSIT